MKRCRSPFCITDSEGRKGREFEAPEDAKGMPAVWCTQCVQIGTQMQFFTKQTAEMIRGIYQSYRPDDLPLSVETVLTQFSREILMQLGEEL